MPTTTADQPQPPKPILIQPAHTRGFLQTILAAWYDRHRDIVQEPCSTLKTQWEDMVKNADNFTTRDYWEFFLAVGNVERSFKGTRWRTRGRLSLSPGIRDNYQKVLLAFIQTTKVHPLNDAKTTTTSRLYEPDIKQKTNPQTQTQTQTQINAVVATPKKELYLNVVQSHGTALTEVLRRLDNHEQIIQTMGNEIAIQNQIIRTMKDETAVQNQRIQSMTMDKTEQIIKYNALLKLYQEQGLQQLQLQKQVAALASHPSHQHNPQVSDGGTTASHNTPHSISISRLGRYTNSPYFKTP
mmetsp:Transcript_25158/g.55175  ORF Transcript_25158/g.55175 Transcript_25158/m.55175 type:complete len:298 (+) Transcript_25158:597-1490(+)